MAHGNSVPTPSPLATLQNLLAQNNAQNQQADDQAPAPVTPAENPIPTNPAPQPENEGIAPVTAPAQQTTAKKQKSGGKKSTGKKKAPAVESDSKLRKASSDPEAVRVSARIPNDYYMDMMHLRAAYGQSMDYTITHALQAFLYDKFTCPSGHTFCMDGSENGTVTPTICPICGDRSIRKIKAGR